ncbi:MAG: macrocin O-methyltransferase, partial [Verrucomicrobiota bacterium]
MRPFIEATIRSLTHRFGIDVVRYQKNTCPPDFSEQNIRIFNAVRPYTMTGPERVNALIESVRYLVANRIDGAMVE